MVSSCQCRVRSHARQARRLAVAATQKLVHGLLLRSMDEPDISDVSGRYMFPRPQECLPRHLLFEHGHYKRPLGLQGGKLEIEEMCVVVTQNGGQDGIPVVKKKKKNCSVTH